MRCRGKKEYRGGRGREEGGGEVGGEVGRGRERWGKKRREGQVVGWWRVEEG